jgi:hypothetical protein
MKPTLKEKVILMDEVIYLYNIKIELRDKRINTLLNCLTVSLILNVIMAIGVLII